MKEDKEKKKSKCGKYIATAVISICISASLTFLFTVRNFDGIIGSTDMKEIYSSISEMDSYVKSHFYTDIDSDKLENGILSGYMSGLDDPYSRYQTPAEYSSEKAAESGVNVSIGVTVSYIKESGYIEVVEVAEDSAAQKSGILKGDIIKKIDGLDVAETGYSESISIIKNGDVGTDAVITVERNGAEKDISVEREENKIISVYSQMLDNNIGYVRITTFNSTTGQQCNEAVSQLVEDGAEALIFDVRGNLGGLVTAVGECLNPLLPEGDIAIATYKDGTSSVIIKSDEQELNLPMAVLINNMSASGAELFAASLRDFKSAYLVGKTSYGKGVMQTTVAMSNGGALTVTVATYQTTKSDCYHGVGLIPDYDVDLDENVSIDDVDVLNDAQLKKAVELLS